MGKISPVSAKYIVNATIQIEGVVDRPDVIGAIFGQTEGLLGSDLELRELQRSGRIGRIEVKTEIINGKTQGEIILPSSLDKAETAIVAAAMETIQRIGPCNSKVKINKIEDVRISKRHYVTDRAKELLKSLTEDILPDSQEITEYGKDRLPAGPNLDEAEEIIVVEGRADVLNLLRQGIKNVIALNGTSVPQTIIDLCKKKIVTVFVDGDHGGNLILKELAGVTEIDYVIKAPDGKEVEELTKKEIHKALRSKVSLEQIKLELDKTQTTNGSRINEIKSVLSDRRTLPTRPMPVRRYQKRSTLTQLQKNKFKEMLDDVMGTRGAYLLDEGLNVLGKVPLIELNPTLRNLSTVNAIIFDGTVNETLLSIAEKSKVNYLVGMSSRINNSNGKVEILTPKEL